MKKRFLTGGKFSGFFPVFSPQNEFENFAKTFFLFLFTSTFRDKMDVIWYAF